MSSGHDDFNDDSNDDSISSGGHKAFKFTIVNNQVTAVFELKDGVLEPKSIDDDGSETYAVQGTEVIRTEVKPFGTEITHYADLDGDGLYNRTSEQWTSSSNAPGSGHFKFEDNLKFFPTNGDDHIAVRGDEDCHGGQGADDFVIRDITHLRIGDFHSSEHDSLIFDTGFGLASRDQLESYVTEIHHDGQDFIVDFGPDVSITLVGVQPDQISWDDVSVLS